MDRIRYFADISVRRAAGLGLVGIALVVAALHFDRTLAMHALAALLTVTRTAYDASGAVVEYGTHVYRASRYSFETTLFNA